MRNRILTFIVVSVFSVFSMSLLQIPLTAHAANRLTTIANKPSVVVYLDHRKVHDSKLCATPTKNCPTLEFIDAGTYEATCQKKGEWVSALGYDNNWWTKLKAPSGKWGWVSNIYIQGGVKIAGVPDCSSKFTLATVYLDHREIHDFHACETPTKDCALLGHLDAGTYPASCQAQGDTVSDLGYTNNWWTKLQTLKGKWGWVNNIYIQGGVKIAGVRDCSSQTKPVETPSVTGPSVTIYLDDREVYDTDDCVTPGEGCSILGTIDAGTYPASCQAQGEKISDLGYTNNWWTKLQKSSDEWGWVNNIYIQGGEKIAGVPDCSIQSPSPSNPVLSYVTCTEGMSPLIRFHQSWGSAYEPTSDLCYNAPMQATETISGITSMCISGGVTITFRTSASSDLRTLAGGSYSHLEIFDPATTVEITEIRDTSGFHLNYCGIG